jgi:hypothetical protein
MLFVPEKRTSPGSRLMAGIRHCEVFLLMALTSTNRLGSKVARDTRINAVAGSDSVTGSYGASGSAWTVAAYVRSSCFEALCRQLSARFCDCGSGKISSSPLATPS